MTQQGSRGFGATAFALVLLAAGGAAAVRPVDVSGALAGASAPSRVGSPVEDSGGTGGFGDLGGLIDLPVNLFEPFLKVYGQRAVLGWRAGDAAILSVEYGETPALGLHATETPPATRSDVGGLLRGQPAAGPRIHKVSLDGLQTGRSYYYRGTLSEGGVVVKDTGVVPFETPIAFVRVRPTEIDMAKDGDHDIEVSVNGNELYDNGNKGEVYLEWSARVKPAPGAWPAGPKVKGCYPGGAAIDLLFPQGGQPDAGGQDSPDYPADDTTFDPTSGAQTPTLHGDPQAWAPVLGCVAYRYDTMISVDSAKIGSGEEVELDPDGYPAMEWELPADLPGEPPATGSHVAMAMMPAGDDWENEPEAPGGGGYTPPPVCGEAPPGTFALVRLGVRGQEFDQVLLLAGLTRIINHDASNADTLCLDLREEEHTLLVGVKAKDGSLEFTIWFEVTLDYLTSEEQAEAAEPLGAIGTPIVIEPIEPVSLAPAPPPGEPQGGAQPVADAEGRPYVNLRAKSKLRETKRSGAKIAVTRTGDTSYPLFVAYAIAGTAQNGVDYEPLQGSLEIPVGKRSAKLVVQPIADGLVEGPETIELKLLPGYGYAEGASSRVSVELMSKDR